MSINDSSSLYMFLLNSNSSFCSSHYVDVKFSISFHLLKFLRQFFAIMFIGSICRNISLIGYVTPLGGSLSVCLIIDMKVARSLTYAWFISSLDFVFAVSINEADPYMKCGSMQVIIIYSLLHFGILFPSTYTSFWLFSSFFL